MQEFFIICPLSPFSVIIPFVPVLLTDLLLPEETHSYTPVSLHMVFPSPEHSSSRYPRLAHSTAPAGSLLKCHLFRDTRSSFQ